MKFILPRWMKLVFRKTLDDALTFKHNYENVLTRTSVVSGIMTDRFQLIFWEFLYDTWLLVSNVSCYNMGKKQFNLYLSASEVSKTSMKNIYGSSDNSVLKLNDFTYFQPSLWLFCCIQVLLRAEKPRH